MATWLLAEFDTKEGLVSAIRRMREQGYRAMDAYSPFPDYDFEEAMEVPRTKIPWIALAAGLTGGGLGYLLLWWTSAVAYPLNVGGFPTHPAPAFIPITFELTILSAGIATFLSVLFANGLPRLWHPTSEIEGFDRTMVDRFWLQIEDRDPKFELTATTEALEACSPLRVVQTGGDEE